MIPQRYIDAARKGRSLKEEERHRRHRPAAGADQTAEQAEREAAWLLWLTSDGRVAGTTPEPRRT